MGIGLLIGLSVASTVVSGIKQASAAKRAEKAQEESRNISLADERYRNQLARRQTLREARIRRARIANAAENTGTAFSSGELGAVSSVAASAGSSIAEQQRDILAKKALSVQEQKYADAQYDYQKAGAFNDIVQKGVKIGYNLQTGKYGDIFGA